MLRTVGRTTRWVAATLAITMVGAALQLADPVRAATAGYGSVDYSLDELTSGDTAFTEDNGSFPSISPDGSRVAYMADSNPATGHDWANVSGGAPELHVRDTDDTTTPTGAGTLLVPGGRADVAFSSSGNRSEPSAELSSDSLPFTTSLQPSSSWNPGDGYATGGTDADSIVVRDIRTGAFYVRGTDFSVTVNAGADGNVATKHDNTATVTNLAIPAGTPLFILWATPYADEDVTLVGTSGVALRPGAIDDADLMVAAGDGTVYVRDTDYTIVTETQGTAVRYDDVITVARTAGSAIPDGATVQVISRKAATGWIEQTFPAWSPDGEWIAFRREVRRVRLDRPDATNQGISREFTQVRLVRPDGTGERVVAPVEGSPYRTAGWPVWSPDGSRLVVPLVPAEDAQWAYRSSTYVLGIYTVATQTMAYVEDAMAGGAFSVFTGIAWDASGRYLKWHTELGYSNHGATQRPEQIRVLDTQTMTWSTVSDPDVYATFSDWSPDGQWIVYHAAGPGGNGPYELWMVRRDGTGRTRIVEAATLGLADPADDPIYGSVNKPQFRPASGTPYIIAFSAGRASNGSLSEIWTVEVDPGSPPVPAAPVRQSEGERILAPVSGELTRTVSDGASISQSTVLGTIDGTDVLAVGIGTRESPDRGLVWVADDGATVSAGDIVATLSERAGWPTWIDGCYLAWRGRVVAQSGFYGGEMLWVASYGNGDQTPIDRTSPLAFSMPRFFSIAATSSAPTFVAFGNNDDAGTQDEMAVVRLAPLEGCVRTTTGPVIDPVEPPPPSGQEFAPPTVGTAQGEVRVGGTVLPLVPSAPGPNQVRYEAGGIRVTFTGAPGTSATNGLVASPSGTVLCEVCGPFTPGSVIEAWLYSSPRLVAAWQVGDGDCQVFEIPFVAPLDGLGPVTLGAHTLQLRLPTDAGTTLLDVGITVGPLTPNRVSAGEGPGSLPARTGPLLLALLLPGLLVAGLGRRRPPHGPAGAPSVG